MSRMSAGTSGTSGGGGGTSGTPGPSGTSGKGKGKGTKKEDRVFDDTLFAQLEQVMMDNNRHLAKRYQDTGTTQAQKSQFWDQVRRKLSFVSGRPMDDPTLPGIS